MPLCHNHQQQNHLYDNGRSKIHTFIHACQPHTTRRATKNTYTIVEKDVKSHKLIAFNLSRMDLDIMMMTTTRIIFFIIAWRLGDKENVCTGINLVNVSMDRIFYDFQR